MPGAFEAGSQRFVVASLHAPENTTCMCIDLDSPHGSLRLTYLSGRILWFLSLVVKAAITHAYTKAAHL